MTTIADKIKIISNDIQNTSEELIKLTIRKTLRPILNQVNSNNSIRYNSFLGKYERGYMGSASDDIVNKYSYVLTRDCIGWTENNVTNFKILAKFIKNNYTSSLPTNYGKIHTALLVKRSKNEKQSTVNKFTPAFSSYKNLINYLTAKNIQSLLSNKAAYIYTYDMPYTDSFKQLESIGHDIINQTDPSISESEAAKLSTCALRAKLHNLETNLTHLLASNPSIYMSYIKMVTLINSIPRHNIIWLINLISNLSFQNWDKLEDTQKKLYKKMLGENFILEFNANELITILLQSDNSELIIRSSYLYSLLKMLYIVFGFSEIKPIIDLGDKKETCEPLDHCIYEYIKLFGDLYPTIVSILGGTLNFPPENCKVTCEEIPQNYNILTNIPEFLWRFNIFSYCKYIQYIAEKQVGNALQTKINNKTKYLKML